MTGAEQIELTSRCLCNAHVFISKTSTDALPLRNFACHCAACRHLTGSLFTFCVRWPGEIQQVLNSTLRSYYFSNHASLRFCRTCSSPLFFHYNNGASEFVNVFVSSLDDVAGVQLARITDHIFVESTIDGGMSSDKLHPNRSSNSNARSVPRWSKWQQRSHLLDTDWPTAKSALQKESGQVDRIPFHCQCESVSFFLRSPMLAFKDTPESSVSLPAFVDLITKKIQTSVDASPLSRRVAGAHVMVWAPGLLEHIVTPDSGMPVAADTANLKAQTELGMQGKGADELGSLAVYTTSPGVQRYHCSICSATVFCATDDKPHVLDIAVGLFSAEYGARAESFLSWTRSEC